MLSMRGAGGRGEDGVGCGAAFLPFTLGAGFDGVSAAVLPPTFNLINFREAEVAGGGNSAGCGVGAALAVAGGTTARGCAARSAASKVLLIRIHSVEHDIELSHNKRSILILTLVEEGLQG